jgi:hypothetical protein
MSASFSANPGKGSIDVQFPIPGNNNSATVRLGSQSFKSLWSYAVATKQVDKLLTAVNAALSSPLPSINANSNIKDVMAALERVGQTVERKDKAGLPKATRRAVMTVVTKNVLSFIGRVRGELRRDYVDALWQLVSKSTNERQKAYYSSLYKMARDQSLYGSLDGKCPVVLNPDIKIKMCGREVSYNALMEHRTRPVTRFSRNGAYVSCMPVVAAAVGSDKPLSSRVPSFWTALSLTLGQEGMEALRNAPVAQLENLLEQGRREMDICTIIEKLSALSNKSLASVESAPRRMAVAARPSVVLESPASQSGLPAVLLPEGALTRPSPARYDRLGRAAEAMYTGMADAGEAEAMEVDESVTGVRFKRPSPLQEEQEQGKSKHRALDNASVYSKSSTATARMPPAEIARIVASVTKNAAGDSEGDMAAKLAIAQKVSMLTGGVPLRSQEEAGRILRELTELMQQYGRKHGMDRAQVVDFLQGLVQPDANVAGLMSDAASVVSA